MWFTTTILVDLSGTIDHNQVQLGGYPMFKQPQIVSYELDLNWIGRIVSQSVLHLLYESNAYKVAKFRYSTNNFVVLDLLFVHNAQHHCPSSSTLSRWSSSLVIIGHPDLRVMLPDQGTLIFSCKGKLVRCQVIPYLGERSNPPPGRLCCFDTRLHWDSTPRGWGIARKAPGRWFLFGDLDRPRCGLMSFHWLHPVFHPSIVGIVIGEFSLVI